MSEIRDLRCSAGLTQAELAAATGIAQPHISAYETGRRAITPEVLERVRSALRRTPSEVLDQHRDRIVELVHAHHGLDVKVFGSAARGDDTSDSDLDLLVEFDTDAALIDQSRLIGDLQELTGLKVDVVSAGGLHGAAGERIRREAVAL